MKILFNRRRNEAIAQLDLTQVDPRIFEDAEDSDNDIQEDVESSPSPLSFVVDTAPSTRQRILEHPAKNNLKHDFYRFCCPCNPRTRIMKATFSELKDTLNGWTPDDTPEKETSSEIDLNSKNTEDIIRKSVIKGKENISDMKLILAFQHGESCKVAMFDTRNQVFLLRTMINKSSALKWGYIKAINIHSFDPEWCVDRSTLLAYKGFWCKLREIINSKK